MKKFIIISFYLIFISGSVIAENIESSANNLFHIGQMNSHNKNFALFFKTRDKAILARGEDYNYVTDFPQDLYIYNYETKISSPLISALTDGNVFKAETQAFTKKDINPSLIPYLF